MLNIEDRSEATVETNELLFDGAGGGGGTLALEGGGGGGERLDCN